MSSSVVDNGTWRVATSVSEACVGGGKRHVQSVGLARPALIPHTHTDVQQKWRGPTDLREHGPIGPRAQDSRCVNCSVLTQTRETPASRRGAPLFKSSSQGWSVAIKRGIK